MYPLLPVAGTGWPVRIDIAKRMAARRRTRNFSILEYHKGEGGRIERNYPKKPGHYALRKNTRRARIYNEWAEKLARKKEEQ